LLRGQYIRIQLAILMLAGFQKDPLNATIIGATTVGWTPL